MHSDTHMAAWWKEKNLEDFIEEFETPCDGHNYEPYPFLQHLHAEKDNSYLHFGVEKYVHKFYKDYNGVGHYTLFQQTEEKDLLKQPELLKATPKATKATEFENSTNGY